MGDALYQRKTVMSNCCILDPEFSRISFLGKFLPTELGFLISLESQQSCNVLSSG